MKQRIMQMAGALGVACLMASCATAYDSQGREVPVMTPEGVAATALVAGLIGYAIADDDHPKHKRYHHGHRGYHGNRGGYYR